MNNEKRRNKKKTSKKGKSRIRYQISPSRKQFLGSQSKKEGRRFNSNPDLENLSFYQIQNIHYYRC